MIWRNYLFARISRIRSWSVGITFSSNQEFCFLHQKLSGLGCTIAKNDAKFPFSVNFEFEGKNYTGCASETNPFFMTGRFGKISSFLTKTGIEYHGSVPTDGTYEMYKSDDLVQIHFKHPANPEKWHYIVLRNNSYDDTIYWNGDNKIDHETCEKFADDKDLMAFGIFYNCKRVYQN